ncbi:MAG: hypothetical protein A2V90_01575 [Gammaproteobacteria bacterium RBG_16_57_12]|nr:MAG: hypothetical protein A2V90_01575 [Gammaproteobacteria bacterium RBG_16_57_12]
MFSLRQAVATCRTHRQALQEALEDLYRRALAATELENLPKEDRRLLDQFAYRYTRLQDDMGNRLMAAVLRALGEEISGMPMLDRLNRLEQLGWLPSADEWADLRRIRNEFTHDYPETIAERFERLQLALASARRLVEILDGIDQRVHQRFPDMEMHGQM